MIRWTRCLIPLTFGVFLALAPAPARAQPPAEEPAEGSSKGEPGHGYIAAGLIIGLALFIVAKSARR